MTNRMKRAQALGLLIAFLAATASFGMAQAAGAAKGKVNINTAGAAELDTLPQIGLKLAQRIIDYRTANGPFKKVEDLMKVQGIGEKNFARLKDLITVGEPAK